MSDWDDFFNRVYECPICERDYVLPSGPQDAKVLLVSNAPGKSDIRSSGVLLEELRKLNVSLSQFRITNVWPHKETKNEECFKNGIELVLEEAKNRDLIILAGSLATKTFMDDTVSSLAGVDDLQSNFFSAPVAVIFDPASCFHGGIGEFRLSLEKAIKKMEETCF